jgi:hypothetical protein
VSQQSINNFKCREGTNKWKTTEEAATAAEQKVVESTATKEKDQESHALAAEVRREITQMTEALVVTDHADLLVRTASVQDVLSERVLREEASAATDQEDHSARVTTDHADLLVRTASVQDVLSERALKEEAAVSETPARRASQKETSTTSAMRMRAESTR